jgi:hypothetical protein
MTEVWLLLEAAQKRIAVLVQDKARLWDDAQALLIDSNVANEQLLEALIDRDAVQAQLNATAQQLDDLAWVLAEGVALLKDKCPEDAEWFAEAEAALEAIKPQAVPNAQDQTSEVERLEAAYTQMSLDAGAEMDRLCTQIAERDALLGRVRVHTPKGAPGSITYQILKEIDALYTNAPPRPRECLVCGGSPLLLCRDCVSTREAQA